MALPPPDGLFSWPPPHWLSAFEEPAPPVPIDPSVAAPQIAPMPLEGLVDPGVVPMAAPPAPVAVPPPVPMEPAVATPEPIASDAGPPGLQPGLGIPTDTIDNVGAALSPQPENPYGSTDWREIVDQAHRDPIGYALGQAQADEDYVQEAQKRVAPVTAQDKYREEQNHRDLMDSMAQADRLAAEVRNTEINPNRFRENQSTLEGIASFISVVVGGLYQAKKGGPNIGLQILDKAIDRDIAAQETSLANKRSLIADLRSSGMSQFQAREAYRVAAYKRALQDVQTSMQDYDPAGTAARNLAKQALEIQGRIAQSVEATRRSAQDDFYRAQKNARENAESLSKLTKEGLEIAKLRGALGGGGGGGGGIAKIKPGDELVTPDEVHRRYPDLPPELVPTAPITEKALSARLEQAGKAKPLGNRAFSIGDATGHPLEQEDGKTFVPNAEEHKTLSAMQNAGNGLVHWLGEVRRIHEEHGGANKWSSPGAVAEYEQAVNQATIAYAAANNLSMSDPQSQAYARNALFGGDPSGYRIGDLDKRIDKAIGRTNDSYNTALRTAKYTGKPYRFPTVSKPKNNATQQDVEDIKKIPDSWAFGPGIADKQIGALADKAASGDDNALTFLQNIGLSADNASVRQAAQAAYAKALRIRSGQESQ